MNNTWELSTIPYLPVMNLVAEHCSRLNSAGVNGMMLSWSLGGYPSPNLEIAAGFSANPVPSIDEVLDSIAAKYYGSEGAPKARKAWAAFSTAFREFPFGAPGGLYSNPSQVGPANPLYLKRTGFAATMVGIPYDDLNAWRGVYPPEVFASQFEKIAAGWQFGIYDLKAAVEKAPACHRDDVQSELRFAQVGADHFQSVANQTRFILARDRLADDSPKLSVEEQQRLRSEIRKILESEIELARREFRLVQEDSRIGFEASNQYVFVANDLAEKIINCRWLLDQFSK